MAPQRQLLRELPFPQWHSHYSRHLANQRRDFDLDSYKCERSGIPCGGRHCRAIQEGGGGGGEEDRLVYEVEGHTISLSR